MPVNPNRIAVLTTIGLIHGQVKLGDWKERLLANPLTFVDAYVARSQQPMALAR